MTAKKKFLFYCLMFLVSYVLVEIFSAIGLYGVRTIVPHHFVRGYFDVDSYFASLSEQDRLEYVELGYDRLLGWDNRPLTEEVYVNSVNEEYGLSFEADGSRVDDLPQKELLIATYGDSFTFGDEVGNHETWQFFLESRIGYEVKNFGVGAFGTGQAVLKLGRHLDEGYVAPITILGIFEENVNRVVNSFRPFYSPGSGVTLGFKPYYRSSSRGRVEFNPNPWDDPDWSLIDLRALAHQLAPQDFWATRYVADGKIYPRLSVRYPYSIHLLRATLYLGARKLGSLTGLGDGNPEYRSLWEADEGRAVMHHLVDEFVTLTEQAGSRPMILFIPEPRQPPNNDAPGYVEFKYEILARHSSLSVVDVMSREFDRERFNIRPYGGHPSAYGNEEIARAIEAELSEIDYPAP